MPIYPIEEVYKSDVPVDMITRFSPPLFRSATWAVCLAFLLNVSSVSGAEYQGPVFPGERVADAGLNEPMPLPRQNSLLQRPSSSKQVVFDGLDPVSPLVSQGILYEEEFDVQPTIGIRQNRIRPRTTRIIDDAAIFVDEGEYTQDGSWQSTADVEGEFVGSYPSASYPSEMGGYYTGPIPMTFGMGLFDNLSLFADATAFKTELDNGVGRFGFAQGINWSTPITPQGTVTAQYGARTIQGDCFSTASRHQTFMTAGIFKRCEFSAVQGGVAVDWLHDHSRLGTVDLRQMRCELSVRSPSNLEYGFIGGFDMFQDRPTTRQINRLARHRNLGRFGAVDVQDYYLLFIRKHLDIGGQVEFRCGATERGDFLISALGEAAISDRLAVNGGISMLAPSEGQSIHGNHRESWTLSLGVVLYFRGGATSRPANLHRPMFDVAGNNSFFTRIVGR